MYKLSTKEVSLAKLKYRGQKHNAIKNRNIGWELSFEVWLQWWLDTGHWEERGSHVGQYNMCRYGDKGSYSIDNIYCDTAGNNTKDRIVSDETREKLRLGRLGKTQTDESKKKCYDANKGRKHTDESKENMRQGALNKPPITDEARKNLSESLMGHPVSDETKRKISEHHKAKPRIICPHCNKTGDVSNMKRWHFDNCKHKL